MSLAFEDARRRYVRIGMKLAGTLDRATTTAGGSGVEAFDRGEWHAVDPAATGGSRARITTTSRVRP